MVYRLTMLFRNAAQNDTISDFKVHVKMAQKKKSGRNDISARRVHSWHLCPFHVLQNWDGLNYENRKM